MMIFCRKCNTSFSYIIPCVPCAYNLMTEIYLLNHFLNSVMVDATYSFRQTLHVIRYITRWLLQSNSKLKSILFLYVLLLSISQFIFQGYYIANLKQIILTLIIPFFNFDWTNFAYHSEMQLLEVLVKHALILVTYKYDGVLCKVIWKFKIKQTFKAGW